APILALRRTELRLWISADRTHKRPSARSSSGALRAVAERIMRRLQVLDAALDIVQIDRPDDALDHALKIAAVPPRNLTAVIAAAISAAPRTDGSSTSIPFSREGAMMRLKQNRNEIGSPASASSIALRLKAAASASKMLSARRLAMVRGLRGRPPGFPECP